MGASILGDLHQEYRAREPGLRRNVWYLGVALALGTGYALPRVVRRATSLTRRMPRGPRHWSLLYDVRQALRTLAKRPVYSITAVVTLGLGLSPHDPLSYLGAAGLLGVVGLLASYLPARRAATIDPMETLRVE